MNSEKGTSIKGKVIVAEYYDVGNTALLENEELIRRELRLALESAGATVYDVTSRKFGPGVTAVAIIGESHGSMHTWPEIAYARFLMDYYPNMRPYSAVRHLQDLLETSQEPIVQEMELGTKDYRS